MRPRPRAGRATRLKRLAFVLLVLGSVGGALGALLLSAQVFDRLSRASAQVDALSLARRPASSATLSWQAPPPGTRQPDGVTLEDLRQAYLLAFSELTYAHGSGDTTGLPGRFGGRALQEAVAATTPRTGALVLDWGTAPRRWGCWTTGPSSCGTTCGRCAPCPARTAGRSRWCGGRPAR